MPSDKLKTHPDFFYAQLAEYGLLILGAFLPVPDDEVPDINPGKSTRQLLLIGNAGSSIWPAFTGSEEFLDGRADPLDRWSRRIGDRLASERGGRSIYPFEGPPYPPFLRWAARSGQVSTSPISMFIHHDFGLWHAYRFALALAKPLELDKGSAATASPCENCSDRPCLDACPVSAFSAGAFHVRRCVDYLLSDDQSACRQTGCVARRACPVGPQYRYKPGHAQFHMQAFIKANG